MKGYVFVSEKNGSVNVTEHDVQSILKKYNGLNDVSTTKSIQSTSQQALFTFTNEPIRIDYSIGTYDFATSGEFLCDEKKVFEKYIFAKNKKAFMSTIGGINTLAVFAENQFSVWNNVTRVEPVYWAETEQRIVVGTKAILVHLLTYNTSTPQYDYTKMLSFLNNGFYANENTPFRNLHILNANSYITVKSNKVFIETIDSFEQDLYSIKPTKSDYDDLTQVFLNSFSYLKKTNVELSTGLTGGKDSRIIVAAMKHLGINFNAHTNGFDSNPDVIVAKKIAHKLNLNHKINIPIVNNNQMNLDLYRRTVNAIKNTEGLLYSYENIGTNYSGFNANKLKFGGQGGAVFKGGYAGNHQFTDKNEVEYFLLKAFNKFNDFFRQEQIEEHIQFVKNFVYNEAKHLKVNDILNYFFLKYRTGRWSSSSMPFYTSLSHVYFPMFENQLVKKAQRFDTKFGETDQILYNILMRIAPELIDIPFADDRWNFESTGPYHREQLVQWISRKPIQATSKLSGFNWRKNILTSSKKQFEEVILGYDSSPLYNFIKRDKVESLFNFNVKTPSKYDTFLWSLYTANILLSNKWYQPLNKKSRISIEIPKQNTQKVVGITKEIRHIPNKLLTSKHKNLYLINFDGVTSVVEWRLFTDEKMYLQLFDKAFTIPPTTDFTEYANTVGKRAKFNFEIEKIHPADFELDLYFIQYNEEERIKSEVNHFYISKSAKQYQVDVSLLTQTKFFKVAFRINKTLNEGKFMLNQMFIEFLE